MNGTGAPLAHATTAPQDRPRNNRRARGETGWTPPNLDALTRDALDYYLFPLATKQDMRTDGPMIFSSAEGMEITDAGGKTYLDMMSTQTRASSLGYGQERIARAIYDQLMSLHYAGTSPTSPTRPSGFRPRSPISRLAR